MSALPPKADIFRGGLDVRLVPKADIVAKGDRRHKMGGSSYSRPLERRPQSEAERGGMVEVGGQSRVDY